MPRLWSMAREVDLRWLGVMVSLARRLEWFDRGAAAARPYLQIENGVEPSPLYACPECFSLFPRESLTDETLPDERKLTVEHVPAGQLGGSEMLLTCKPCNNRAGTRLEHHAHRAEQLHRLQEDGLRQSIRSRIEFPDIGWVAADVAFDVDAGFRFHVKARGSPKQNVSALNADLSAWLAASTRDGTSFTVDFHGLTHLRPNAEAAWLRAAYLATCAQFGYGIIRDPVYTLVREQIRQPDASLGLRPFVFPSPRPSEWAIGVVSIDSGPRNFIAMMGRHMVHLPWPGDGSFWPRLHTTAKSDTPVHFKGVGRAWPTEPTFEIDRFEATRAAARDATTDARRPS